MSLAGLMPLNLKLDPISDWNETDLTGSFCTKRFDRN